MRPRLPRSRSTRVFQRKDTGHEERQKRDGQKEDLPAPVARRRSRRAPALTSGVKNRSTETTSKRNDHENPDRQEDGQEAPPPQRLLVGCRPIAGSREVADRVTDGFQRTTDEDSNRQKS